MNILVLQMKRIGDLVLTVPALAALRPRFPDARITLVVSGECKSLLPAIVPVDERLAYSRREGNDGVWSAIWKTDWDVCLDFTGNDRSALMTWVSRAKRRITFDWVRQKFFKKLAYNEFVESSVRLNHTVDHYLDLLKSLGCREAAADVSGQFKSTDQPDRTDLVLVHPGTARPEKYWLPERWAEVVGELQKRGRRVVVTCGPDSFEQNHVELIVASLRKNGLQSPEVVYPASLLELAARIEGAGLVISCDTAVVHIAAVSERPQIVLFGPTNPFHWRPRHAKGVVISAAQPGEPLTVFDPKMKGAAMDAIPIQTVLAAVDGLSVRNVA